MDFEINDAHGFLSAFASSLASPRRKNSTDDPECIVVGCAEKSSFHCPVCKLSYCTKHAGSLQMRAKLSEQNCTFDPTLPEKFEKRICVYCYWEERPGYVDAKELPVTNHIEDFKLKRQAAIERLELGIVRLEKRISVLSEFKDIEGGVGAVPFNEYCQRIVPWEDDEKYAICPICEKTRFGLLKRKHHCRLCGVVMCGDCVENFPLRILRPTGTSAVVFEIKICLKCHSLIFRYHFLFSSFLTTKTKFNRKRALKTPVKSEIVILFSKYMNFKMTIEGLLPRYNYLLTCLEYPFYFILIKQGGKG